MPDRIQPAMKAIWTLLFLAIIGSTFGITALFVEPSQWNETFWLSIGTVMAAELFLWIAVAFRTDPGGEQAGSMARLSILAATFLYFFLTVALALVAIFSTLSFKIFLALHVVSLLAFVILAGMSALGTRVLQTTREAQRPR